MALEVATEFLEGFAESFTTTMERRRKKELAEEKKRAAAFKKAVNKAQKETDTRADKIKIADAVAANTGYEDNNTVKNYLYNQAINFDVKDGSKLQENLINAINTGVLDPNVRSESIGDISIRVDKNVGKNLDLPPGVKVNEAGLVTFPGQEVQSTFNFFGDKSDIPIAFEFKKTADASTLAESGGTITTGEAVPVKTITEALAESGAVDVQAMFEKPFPSATEMADVEKLNNWIKIQVSKGNFKENNDGTFNFNKQKYGENYASAMQNIYDEANAQNEKDKFKFFLELENFNPSNWTQKSFNTKIQITRKLLENVTDDKLKKEVEDALTYAESIKTSLKVEKADIPIWDKPSEWTEAKILGIKEEVNDSSLTNEEKQKKLKKIRDWEKATKAAKEDNTLSYLKPGQLIGKTSSEIENLIRVATDYKANLQGENLTKADILINGAQTLLADTKSNENDLTDELLDQKTFEKKGYHPSVVKTDQLNDINLALPLLDNDLKILKETLASTSDDIKSTQIQNRINELLTFKTQYKNIQQNLQKKQNLTEILDDYKNFEGNPAPELASKFLNITNKINNIKQDNMNEFGQVSNEAKNLINELKITQKNIQEAYKIKLSEEDIMQGLNVNENYITEVDIRINQVQSEIDRLEGTENRNPLQNEKLRVLNEQIDLLNSSKQVYSDNQPWETVYLGKVFNTNSGDSYIGVDNSLGAIAYARKGNKYKVANDTTGRILNEGEVTALQQGGKIWVATTDIEKIDDKVRSDLLVKYNEKRDVKFRFARDLLTAFYILDDKPGVMNRFLNVAAGAVDVVNELQSTYAFISQALKDNDPNYNIDKEYSFEEMKALLPVLKSVEGRKEFQFVALGLAYGVSEARGSTGMALSDRELQNTIVSLGLKKGNPNEAKVKLAGLFKNTIDDMNNLRNDLVSNSAVNIFLARRADQNPQYLSNFEDYLESAFSNSIGKAYLIETIDKVKNSPTVYRFGSANSISEAMYDYGEKNNINVGLRKKILFNMVNKISALTEEYARSKKAKISSTYTLEQYKNDELNKALTTDPKGLKFKPTSRLTLEAIEYLRANPSDEVKQQFFSKFEIDPNFLLFEE